MSLAEIIALCADAGLQVKNGRVEIGTFSGRKHTVQVHDPAEGLVRLSATVARAGSARKGGIGNLQCWERNRLSELIGFRIGDRGAVIGETWIPLEGISAAVLKVHIEHLALASDRFEHHVTGEDEF